MMTRLSDDADGGHELGRHHEWIKAMNASDKERLEELAEVLEAYGSAPRRWPEEARARLLAFVEGDKMAARMLAEARALDRLLGLAPDGGGWGRLEVAILAAAQGLPQQGRGAAADVPHWRETVGGAMVAQLGRPLSRIWPELTLLAASLFLGLLIGLSGQAVPALQDIVLMADSDGLGALSELVFDRGDAYQEAL
jgi:hypothetical protein